MLNKIAVMGAHSIGKSTLTFNIAHYLKIKGENVAIVQETVRNSPFPINEQMQPETSMWAYHSQIARELEYQTRGYNYIISDRTPIDTFLYAKYFNLFEKNKLLYYFMDSAIEWLKTYNKIFLLKADVPIVSDGVRSMNEIFRTKIDHIFHDFVEEYKPNNVQVIKSSTIFKDGFKYEWIN